MSRSIAARSLRSLAIPAVLAFAALHATAAPVSVTTVSFAAGSGYGLDANEGSGTLLGVLFSNAVPQDFELSMAGDSYTFTVGTFQLVEANSSGGINANEVDNLGVTATLDFGALFGSIQLAGTGAATLGAVSDSAIDLTLDWEPVQAAFGSGGLLGITMNDLAFATPTTLAQTMTVTLIREPVVSPLSTVPEPGSLALMGAAFAGLAFARRRRQVQVTPLTQAMGVAPPTA